MTHQHRRNFFTGIEAALFVISPLPFLFIPGDVHGFLPKTPQTFFGYLAPIATILASLIWNTYSKIANVLFLLVLIGSAAAGFHFFAAHPSTTLFFNILAIAFFFTRLLPDKKDSLPKNLQKKEWKKRISWAAFAGIMETLVIPVSRIEVRNLSIDFDLLVFALFLLFAAGNLLSVKMYLPFAATTLTGGILGILHHFSIFPHSGIFWSAIYLAIIIFFTQATKNRHKSANVLATLLNQPARVLILSFALLIVSGTALLMLPHVVTTSKPIHIIDAAFTSVSAVCVTGLIVLDTPIDFSFFGQGIILLLIQAGGLGIMSITAVAIHAIGHRISLRQEWILSEITENGHHDLINSILMILKFTAVLEGLGALTLTVLFLQHGDMFFQALWRGIFTSVSAFCNAGFALQSDSLVRYREVPAILGTVAFLIVAGGMAPVTFLAIPKLFRRQNLPVAAVIPLSATIILLISGTFLFLFVEWRGMLAGLTPINKFFNAFFQSVTLRTAGFNSLDISQAKGPTFLIMLLFMFIGGSPGGTAGGVKTAVAGVLALTFWVTITNRKNILIRNRRIITETIFRSVTIVISGCIIWFCTVIMLMSTQQIGMRDLVFEAMSALGTVGLSTGATAKLDELGKIIIMIAMFAGRVGPMTLFMFLGNEKIQSGSKSPDASIPLT